MTVIRTARTRTAISTPTITPMSAPLPCGVVVSVGVGEGERKEEEGEKGEGGGSVLLSGGVGVPVRKKNRCTYVHPNCLGNHGNSASLEDHTLSHNLKNAYTL